MPSPSQGDHQLSCLSKVEALIISAGPGLHVLQLSGYGGGVGGGDHHGDIVCILA